MPYGIVYKITCVISGKSYIGITRQTLARRWNAHVIRALNHERGASALAAAIRKYGRDAFIIIELGSEPSYARLVEAERDWIAHEGTESPAGYNLTSGGEGALNPSVETRAKMRSAHLGKKQSPELIAKRTAGQKGRKRSAAAIEASRLKQLGVKRGSWGRHTPESIEKMRAACRLRPPMSSDARKRAGAARKGKSWGQHTDETREKMRTIYAERRFYSCGHIFNGLLSAVG